MKRTNQRAFKSRSDNAIGYDFLTIINHVTRKQMDTIIEMTRLTLGTDLDAAQRGYLENAMASADAMVCFLNDVIDFSNIKTHQLALEEIDFNLRNTLDHVGETLTGEMKSGRHQLTWHIAPDVPLSLMGDPGRLRQIIVNLMRNALPFINDEAVTIHLEAEKKEDASVSLHFAVSGIGIGVSQDQIASVFERFRPVDDFTLQEYGSRAVGLSLSKHLVKMMGGRIWLESDLGNGSSLHFTARFVLSQTRTEKITSLGEIDLSHVRVLIVDDNEINRLVFKRMIGSRGVVPVEATNGEEAIQKAEKAFHAGKPYQIILLDLQMPGMDGFEVARNVKACHFGADAQILLLTSVGQKGDTARCREVGISGYLLKPVRQSELLDAIALALSRPTGTKMQVITRFTIQEARRKLGRPFETVK
jgi:CheY-like chemotaxis protein